MGTCLLCSQLWGWLPTLALTELALSCCSGEMLDLLSQVLWLVGAKDSSSTLRTTGSKLPPASGVDEQHGRRKAALPIHVATARMGNGQLSHGHSFRALSPTPVLTVLTQLSCPGKVQDLLSQMLQAVGVRNGSSIL